MATHARNTQAQRPALRLVSTRDMRREDWLEVRKRGIGASDAAAACGISPYQSRLELWMIKTGRDQELPKPDPEDMETPMFWGNVLEPIVAQNYARKTGNKVRRLNAVLQHPDPDKAWMLANLDYTVVGNDAVQILECKTAGEFGARLWRDGVPDYVQCQVQHQLAVTGKQAADVCVLLCGQKLEVFRVERDEVIINHLINLEREFWHYVETDTAPPVDGSDSAGRALVGLYPRDAGTLLDFSENASLCGDFDELLDLREMQARLKARESLLKQRIQASMGDASKAVFPNGEISWKRSEDSTVLDTKKLLKMRPQLLQQYGVPKAGSRRFLIRT